MTNWLHDCSGLAAGTPAVLVTVATTQGSCPRETGAAMLVTADQQFDTIGGGHLEMRACDIARGMLTDATGAAGRKRRLERFPLGPGLGQCCGGVVHLAFESLDPAALAAIEVLRRRRHAKQESWRLVPLDEDKPFVLLDRQGRVIGAEPGYALPLVELDAPCRVVRDASGERWLVAPCLPWRAHLVLFGAGHVGTAIVHALAELPCHITWVDEREELFPSTVPANVQIEATDTPEMIADTAAPGSTFLVLTHSHALDQRLSEHILRRPYFPGRDWFGLIGSLTKRRQFEHRLAERGINAQRLQDMVCPIGLPGVTGKAPAVIAASVVAQLLQVWEAQERANTALPEQELARARAGA
ncbi:MAG: xanthine dehydrogenase accessory protein XdhC [Burkholderiaceae bacterium]|nr:xanthine dehydrogenase accessory protein XdhC [Burkholderiaceae bacterium]